MPLPAALAAKLLKRGIINGDNANNDPAEEVIAEEYDEVPVEKKKSTVQTEDNQLVDKVSACPNLSNPYHVCSDYCIQRWGNKRFKPDPKMISKRERMLEKYPIPENWLEVGDPATNRYYYWNTQTDEVSWLPPSHPRAHVTLSENRLKELNTPLPSRTHYNSEGESDSASNRDEDEEEEDEEDHNHHRRGGKQTQHRSSKGRRRRDDGEVDPMDPSAYSDVPRGDWKSGLDQRGTAKTGVDVTASGPLFQQRPYPSPGAILRMNKGSKD